MKNKKYHKVGTCTQNNRNIVERSVIDTLTHKYITVQFPGVSHAIRYKKKRGFCFLHLCWITNSWKANFILSNAGEQNTQYANLLPNSACVK